MVLSTVVRKDIKGYKMDLAERYKARRLELGLTQNDIALKLGVSRQSLQKIEYGMTLNPRKIGDIAKVLKCEPDWLLFGKGGQNNAFQGPEIQGKYPLISWVQAGDRNEIDKQNTQHHACPVKCSAQTFILEVRGMSMHPTFNEGELIFVDPEVDAINGKFIVARLDDENEATFKKLIIEGEHKYLKAENPAWPNPIQLINGNCSIVGVVIFAGRLL